MPSCKPRNPPASKGDVLLPSYNLGKSWERMPQLSKPAQLENLLRTERTYRKPDALQNRERPDAGSQHIETRNLSYYYSYVVCRIRSLLSRFCKALVFGKSRQC